MGTNDPGPRSNTLTQAASLVFALVAVIPLLLFLYSLYSLNALRTTRYQIILAAALGVALFGLYILRLMVGRMSALIRAVPRPAAMGPAATGPDRSDAGPSVGGRSAPREVRILGIGSVQEFAEMNEILNQMWRAEAWSHMGRSVRISLRDARGSVAGMLTRIADDSLVLEVDGRQETIDFDRMSAIEPVLTSPSDP